MPRGINDLQETYDIVAGQPYCAHCMHWLHDVRYRWRGEKTLYCLASCAIMSDMKKEMVSDATTA